MIIHQELALIPEHVDHREHLPRQRAAAARRDRLARPPSRRPASCWPGSACTEDPDTLIKDIGVGKQQLVEIAKAFAKDVKLLILDEPTAALNEADSQHLLDLLRGLRAAGITSIMISHKLNEIEQIADSITILRDGKTIETLDVTAGGVDEDRIIRGMVGRELSSRFPDHTPEHRRGASSRCGTGPCGTRSRPTAWSARTSSFIVRRGEIVGFAGLMGAGRTELAMSLFGRSYGIYVGGHDLQGRQGDRARRRWRTRSTHGLAYVSEDRKAIGLNLLDDIKTVDGGGQAVQDHARPACVDERPGVQRCAEALPEEPAHQGARPSTRASPSSPAATSRRSCWRSGCSPTPTC